MKEWPQPKWPMVVMLCIICFVITNIFIILCSRGMFSTFRTYPVDKAIREMEEQFGWRLPEDAQQGKAARRRFSGREELIMTFQTENDKFRRSLPANKAPLIIGASDVFDSMDTTGPTSLLVLPGQPKSWWKPQIRAGGTAIFGGAEIHRGGTTYYMDFLADTAQEKACVVYISVEGYFQSE